MLVRSKLLDLRTLIVLLALIVTVLTFANGFHATYQVQKKQLIKQTLETNEAYARKIAESTNNFIYASHQKLAVAATVIQNNLDDTALLAEETERLRIQTNSFNAVIVVNNEGVALSGSPFNKSVAGNKLTTRGIKDSLKTQEPFVSTPYISTLGNLMTMVSYPMFSKSGEYLGFIGGAIYLNERSILNDLLGTHFHEDGTYIYVVDKNQQLIFHPNLARVATYPKSDIASYAIAHKGSGSIQGINSRGIEMLAGFASIESLNWNIVSQRPIDDTLAQLDDLMWEVIVQMIPLTILTLIIIWIVAHYVSRPLRRLADRAKSLNNPTALNELSKTRAWYFESNQLKQAMLRGLNLMNAQINQLKKDAATDPLTGAFNRRSLQMLLEHLESKNISFSALAIDIDHFKQVNDTYGHAGGDKALVALTQITRQICRENDIIARTGGEEFALMLPNTDQETAHTIAERLRERVANMHIEPVGYISISIGIASFNENSASGEEVLNQADQALYKAKNLGRNRCEVFVPNG